MSVYKQTKARADARDRDGDTGPKFKRSTSGANALCWLRRKGYFARKNSSSTQ